MPRIDELTLAKELIRFPTITPNDSGIMKFLEKKLKNLGFKTKILEFREKKFRNSIPLSDKDLLDLCFDSGVSLVRLHLDN